MVGAEGGETNFWQKKNILVPYGTELPGVPKLTLQETGCLIFNREDLILSCYTTVTPIALVGILVCGFPSDIITKKKKILKTRQFKCNHLEWHFPLQRFKSLCLLCVELIFYPVPYGSGT